MFEVPIELDLKLSHLNWYKMSVGPEARFSMKVPPQMRNDLTYREWKHELLVWCRGTNVAKAKQGITVAWSLTGDVRKTVMSEVTIDDMDCEDGIKNILVLDKHFEKDSAQAGLIAFDSFIEYRRPKNVSIKEYLIGFNLKYNTIKSYQMELPDNILAALLLKCANLPEDKAAMCRATCTTLTYESMKKQIEKVGCDIVTSTNRDCFAGKSEMNNECVVKIEPFHGNCSNSKPVPNYESSCSDEDDDYQNAFYSYNYRSRGEKQRFTNNYQKPKLNPPDEFGIPTTCSYCKSVCHWLQKCPDAPPEYKQSRSFYKKKKSRSPL